MDELQEGFRFIPRISLYLSLYNLYNLLSSENSEPRSQGRAGEVGSKGVNKISRYTIFDEGNYRYHLLQIWSIYPKLDTVGLQRLS